MRQRRGLGLTLPGPVAMIAGEEIAVGLEVEHDRTVAPKCHGRLLLVGDLAPGLDDVLLGVGHIVEPHGQRIDLVAQGDDRLRATVHGLLLHVLIVEVGGLVAIGMGHGHSGLEEVLAPRGGISLMATRADCSIGGGIDLPGQVVVVGRIAQLVAEIDLVEAPLGRHLQYKVSLVRRYPNSLLGERHGRDHAHRHDKHQVSFHVHCYYHLYFVSSHRSSRLDLRYCAYKDTIIS